MTTGDFERFVAHDVVACVDAHDRTIPDRSSRGLVGPLVACCLAPRGSGPASADLEKAVAGMKAPSDGASLPFLPRAQLATAAAWSPNLALGEAPFRVPGACDTVVGGFRALAAFQACRLGPGGPTLDRLLLDRRCRAMAARP